MGGKCHFWLFVGLLSSDESVQSRSVCRTEKRVFFIVQRTIWTQKRREVGRCGHVCRLRQILTPRHAVAIASGMSGLLPQKYEKSLKSPNFFAFFSIKTPFRRSKPDSLQLLQWHFCRFEPVFCPSEPFSPLFVCNSTPNPKKAPQNAKKGCFLIAKHFLFLSAFSKTLLRFANLEAKLFLLENTQILSHFFASKNGVLSVLFTFCTPPSYCTGGTMLLYWEYNVIVLGLQ